MGSLLIRRLSDPADRLAELAADVRRGLTSQPKRLPSKWLYDDRGSALFERITELPEYYLTRAETEILEREADAIVSEARPAEIVELGSGSSRKTRLLVEAMGRVGSGRRYVAVDVSEGALKDAGAVLAADYPWLDIEGLAGDFGRELTKVPRHGRRMVTFLGSTIGNLAPRERPGFLREVRRMLRKDDSFLLGVDLVKDEATLVAAYDDAAGVSAEFNRNVLHVLNRELDGDLPVEAFEHVTRFHSEAGCMAQSLRATRHIVARMRAIDLVVEFEEGEELHTEWSCKFTREGLEGELEDAGLQIVRWWTDSGDRFALTLAAPTDPGA